MLFIRNLLGTLLIACDPVLRLTETWGLRSLGAPFYEEGENTCPSEGGCPSDQTSGVGGNRGAPPRPDPKTQQEGARWPWSFSWFVKLSLKLIHNAAQTSLLYCGTLCASIGLAAKWAYWLATGTVALFLLQLLVWSFTWIFIPGYRHLSALWKYLRGHDPWHEVAYVYGVHIFRPRWVGPRGREEWTSGYVQQEVRGRGEGREPLDLLVTDGTAIARLRHGTLRGRTNRFGFKAERDSVHASSHRYLRAQIEGMECKVHLCANHPCGQPDDDCLHVVASALIPRTVDYDIQDAAGKGPIARCATAAWLCGYTSVGFCGSVWKGFKRFLNCIFCSPCCRRRRRKRARSRPPPNGGTSSGTLTPRHEDSETESEAEEETACQAESVAYLVNGKATPLSVVPCRDTAKGDKIRLLASDAEVSSAEDLRHEDGNLYFSSCHQHRAIYEGQAAKRTCAIEGCDREVKLSKNGLKLCKMHGAKEERTKTTRNRASSSASTPQGKDNADPNGALFGPEARTAPGLEVAKRPSSSNPHGAALLAKYLKAVIEGKDEKSCLSLCVSGDRGPRETWEELKEQATGYVTKLPKDYPPIARKAIVNLVTEDCPEISITAEEGGPILELGKILNLQKEHVALEKEEQKDAGGPVEVLPPTHTQQGQQRPPVDPSSFYRPMARSASHLGCQLWAAVPPRQVQIRMHPLLLQPDRDMLELTPMPSQRNLTKQPKLSRP